jgi:transglutaminase-like putative cysteine protease
MRTFGLSVITGVLLLLIGQADRSARLARADEPQGKVVLDLWDVAYMKGGKAGFVHTIVREYQRDGARLYQATVGLNLTVKRFQDTIQLRMDTGTTETAAGKVVGIFMRQYLGQGKNLEITGTVAGKQLRLTLDRTKPLKPAPWDDNVIGLYRQQRLFADRKVQPGDEFSYPSFEPTINLVVKNHVRVKDFEDVELFGGKSRKRLLRVETRPEKIQNVQLPLLVTWVDKEYVPWRSEVEAPGLGKIVLYRTTREVALAPANVANLTDIGISQYVRLKKRIVRPYDTSTAVYRVTIRDDDDPGTTFSRDGRQQVKKLKGNTFELHVRSSRGPQADKETKAKAAAEFIESSYFINCADALVQKHARRAVGSESDPWQKALRVEKWVHDHMKTRADEALATADHVARTLSGDCTEYAMLTAAMCRAEGVPSRTAVGLIYADVRQGPVFAFHMWTEVWIKGQWIPMDATLGRGHVGATHLKITDQSWHDTRTLTPLFPVVRVLGRVAIDVLAVEGSQD